MFRTCYLFSSNILFITFQYDKSDLPADQNLPASYSSVFDLILYGEKKTNKTKNKNKVIVDPHILSMISKVP